MKFKLSMVLTVTMLSVSSFAQNSSTARRSLDDGMSSEGFRVGLIKPNLDWRVEVSAAGFSGSGSGTLDNTTGLTLGYAQLPIMQMGWTANAALMEIVNDGSSVQLARADGNLAYAFNKNIHAKGGLNLSKFVKGNNIKDLSAGLGIQAGLGLQVNKNFGIDVGYTEMHQHGTIRSTGSFSQDFNVEYKLSGLEIGVNGTF